MVCEFKLYLLTSRNGYVWSLLAMDHILHPFDKGKIPQSEKIKKIEHFYMVSDSWNCYAASVDC